MAPRTIISGWGNYPKQEAQLLAPSSCGSMKAIVKQESGLIARGMGRSYGDSANGSTVLQTNYCDHFIEFDEDAGTLTAEAGITLREILKVIAGRGWFLPVTPGTSYVTLGGAIASDVHGKNHHIAGTFGQHVIFINILLGTGEFVRASQTENADLFHATCGGMGLTGVITSATIRLRKIRSAFINTKTIKAECIEAACEAFDDNKGSTYSVAWIDCLSKGRNLGRSVLSVGEHAEDGGLSIDIKDPISVPFHTPGVLLNSGTMKAFNIAYWHRAKHLQTQTLTLMPYFYPLDMIGSWNKIYGKPGFVQYQCVIPKEDGIANMRRLLTEITERGGGSFLAVLKQFGGGNNNLLSFPIEGYTLALDFKFSRSILSMFHSFDELVVSMGGRVYLAKDAVMQEQTFKSTYPKWELFQSVREKYGAMGTFSSVQSKRLGLE